MKKALDFFLSLRTAIWLLAALIIFFLIGSMIMPSRPEYKALYIDALLPWMQANSIGLTWWLWLAMGVTALLAGNTLVCSIDALIRKRESRQWLLIISPQVVHLGFLCILLGHLLSSAWGMKGTAVAYQGTSIPLPQGEEIFFQDLRAVFDQEGHLTDWAADVKYFKQGQEVGSDVVRPNSPSFRHGLGIYIQTVRPGPQPIAIVEASREPGAGWALAGGVLFLAGMTTLLLLKVRREEKSLPRA